MTLKETAPASRRVLLAEVRTQGTSAGVRAGPGRWSVTVELRDGDELLETYTATGEEADAHANRTFLKAAEAGLAYAVQKGAVVVTIHTGLQFMAESGNLLPVWRDSGWVGLGGNALTNTDVLEQIYQLSRRCLVVHWAFQPSSAPR